MLAIVGWLIILGILWRVPEYRFLIFFILANNALFALLLGPGLSAMTPAQWQGYLMAVGQGDLIFAAIGAPFIAFRKWQRTQKSGAERRAEALVAAARADETSHRGSR